MSMDIRSLPRAQYRGYPLPFVWRSGEGYAVSLGTAGDGWRLALVRQPLPAPVARDTTEALYADWWPTAAAWGAFDGETLMGAVEFFHETWNNRLRVTNLAVLPAYRRRGVGAALMDRAKEEGRALYCRSVVLETQTHNAPAIDFYRCQGFVFTGLDLTAYHDDDAARGEVRLELCCPLGQDGGKL